MHQRHEIVLFSVCIDCFLCVAKASAKIRCGIVVFTDLGIQTQQHLMDEAPNIVEQMRYSTPICGVPL